MTARVPRLSYFFPAHNEEANLAGLVEEALGSVARAGGHLRDHRGRRRFARPDAGDRRRAGRGAPRSRPRRPPPDEPRLRRRAPLGPRGCPLRARRLHRRRPPVPRRGPRPPDRAARRGRPPGRRRRLPHQARRSPGPHDLRAAVPPRQPHLLRPAGHRRRLRLQAVPARRAGGPARRVRRCLLLGRAADQAAGRRTFRGRGRRAALPADGGLADGREAVGGVPGDQGLLAAPPADVGQPLARAAEGGADPRPGTAGRLSCRAGSRARRARRRAS